MDRTVEGTRATAAERAYVLVPRPRRVGPGRIERDYQGRIERLQQDTAEERERLRRAQLELAGARGELETAARVERGLQRLADRLEERVETAAQREKRLILALGALQKENELLRGQLALGGAPGRGALPAPGVAPGPRDSSGPREAPARARARGARPRRGPVPRPGLFARLFGRKPSA